MRLWLFIVGLVNGCAPVAVDPEGVCVCVCECWGRAIPTTHYQTSRCQYYLSEMFVECGVCNLVWTYHVGITHVIITNMFWLKTVLLHLHWFIYDLVEARGGKGATSHIHIYSLFMADIFSIGQISNSILSPRMNVKIPLPYLSTSLPPSLTMHISSTTQNK